MSRNRERMRELLAVEGLSDEQRTELDTLTVRAESLEVEYRAAVIAFPDPVEAPAGDGESTELQDLEERASLGEIFTAALEHRATSGAEAELQQHHGMASNQVPLALLEDRAVTPAPADVGQNQQTIIPAVFPQSAAAFLGISMPTVGVGEPVYPVLATSAVVGAPAEGAVPSGTGIGSEGETTGSFTANVLSPSRLQASFFYSREDRARFAGMDSALRQNLSDALSDELDNKILAGLFADLTAHDVSAQTTYALYRNQLAYGRVDGRWANTVADIRILMGAATYGHAAAAFRSDNAGDRAALEDLQQVTGGVRVSDHVPAVASKGQDAIIRLGNRMDAVAPMWEGVTLIPDEVTRAKTGEIVITAVMLYAFQILRSGGFYRQEVQVAA